MKKLVIAAAVAAICGTAAADGPEFKFSGFGTVGAVHSNDKTSDFISATVQQTGAGHTDSWSTNPDTKLGGQVNAIFNDKLSAVVQVVSQHQYDNSYSPEIEWANIKYQLTPELSLRAGRIALPSFLLSETRYVGYASPWVRVPQEVYRALPLTSNDGVDASYRSQIGGANNTLQVYYGGSESNVSPTAKVKTHPSTGINDTVELGALSLRAGYNRYKLDFGVPALLPLLGLLPPALAQKYSIDGMSLSSIALGATYDPGNWFVMSEFVNLKAEGLLSDGRSWYVSGGYRFGNLTPYITYANTKSTVHTETGAGGLNASINAVMGSFASTQDSVSLGLRWDFMKNVALKAQYDRVSPGDGTKGRLVSYSGFVSSNKINVVSVALDFVF